MRINIKNKLCVKPENIQTSEIFAQHTELTAAEAYALKLIDEIFHYFLTQYMEKAFPGTRNKLEEHLAEYPGSSEMEKLLQIFEKQFFTIMRNTYTAFHTLDDLIILWITNKNPAISNLTGLFDDSSLKTTSAYEKATEAVRNFFAKREGYGPDNVGLIDFLLLPAKEAPDNLEKQLLYILHNWTPYIGKFKIKLLKAADIFKEKRKGFLPAGPGPAEVLQYNSDCEKDRFSDDTHWMPNVVMIAKNTLVWLYQLSEKYGKDIRRLDQIPEEELDILAQRGINTLWLIGIWERSEASKKIKITCGNPEAESSAYSIKNYEIAAEIGGWHALDILRKRCSDRRLRLASDMVPNHTGIDSDWIDKYPDRFIQLSSPPYPDYSFEGMNLSSNPETGIFLEDHYYDRTDAAVVFKHIDYRTGRTRYIYHGNDGTAMPWNDTAQLNYLKSEVREAVIKTILRIARNFQIIRFDAAMTLAKKHIQRLWYPAPGTGGDIPSRAERGMSTEDFDRMMPIEFWREVVDRVAAEVPDTLLLAEAFWMMEGFFVKTLGMHRVYNSIFMNMLKSESNRKYKESIKNTLVFDPEILKRFVNFMNNPDEETAAQQFGKGDKYFGICTMMVTMPGLPMFGHGQIEGFREKYGMEYRKAYLDEVPDKDFIKRHNREIFPLLKKRYLFSESASFLLFDLITADGEIDDNVFIWSNKSGNEYSLVAYNNCLSKTSGLIYKSAPKRVKGKDTEQNTTARLFAEALDLKNIPDQFIYFTEIRSGLTFIHSAEELFSRGLFIDLDGYENRVFLNFTSVTDNDNSWKTLAEKLNGDGIRDIIRFKRKLSLIPASESLRAIFSGERVLRLAEMVTDTGTPDYKFFFDLQTDFQTFIKILAQTGFLDKSQESAMLQQMVENSDKLSILLKSPEDMWMQYIFTGFSIMPESPVLLLAWIVLSPLKLLFPDKRGKNHPDFSIETEKFIEDLEVDELLQNCMTGTIFTESDITEITSLLKLIVSYSPDNMKTSCHMLKEYFTVPKVKNYMNVNIYKGTTWFKRESFQTFTWWIYLLSRLFFPDNTEAAGEIPDTWLLSEEKSDCDLKKLLEHCKI